MFREHRLKAGPGFGSMVPERQSRMVKIVWRSPSRRPVLRLVKKNAAGMMFREENWLEAVESRGQHARRGRMRIGLSGPFAGRRASRGRRQTRAVKRKRECIARGTLV